MSCCNFFWVKPYIDSTTRELRVCNCDSQTVQSEVHVLFECPRSQPKRQKFRNLNYANIDTEVLKIYD